MRNRRQKLRNCDIVSRRIISMRKIMQCRGTEEMTRHNIYMDANHISENTVIN